MTPELHPFLVVVMSREDITFDWQTWIDQEYSRCIQELKRQTQQQKGDHG